MTAKMRYIRLFASTILILSNAFLFRINAQVTLPSIFGDNMVLQQNSKVTLWGWADPGGSLSLSASWDTTTYRTTCDNTSKWSINISTPKAGGPYTIKIKASNEVILHNVMVGEVWLCSGQSNMEMNASWGILGGDSAVKNSTNPNIRFFQVKKIASENPQENCFGKWTESSPETMKSFSAAGYFFGKQLYDSLKVPIGLINSSWGGTPAEPWVKKELIQNDPDLAESAKKLQKFQWWPTAPGLAYNAMIAPIVPYGIAGVIWYQGESNVGFASTYNKLLSTLIRNWRTDFGKEFPFYYVQIAPYIYSDPNGTASSLLREAQSKVQDVPKTGMVVITDLVNDVKDIHPKDKKTVGVRLANMALSETYGFKGLPYNYPMFKYMKPEKNKLRIYFSNAEDGLISRNGAPTTFEIAGEDRQFVPAEAKIDKNTVIVWSPKVKKPVAVRFSFTNAAISNLFSKEGLPVAPFRTDSW